MTDSPKGLEPGVWYDYDGFMRLLLVGSGLLDREGNYKWVFWSKNPLGDIVSDFMIALVAENILEYDADNMRFRVPDPRRIPIVSTCATG